MAHYIDAEKLIAEINKIRHNWLDDSTGLEVGEFGAELGAAESILDSIDDIIDSLQQEQPIQVNTLTWKDINDLERIINNVHYEFRNGISQKGFGEEVLERFMEERDEQEQPEVDLKKEIKEWVDLMVGTSFPEQDGDFISEEDYRSVIRQTAIHFIGLNARK